MTSVKAHCPDCGELVTITPTGKKKHESYSAEWQRVLEHWSGRTPCPGSGKLL